jgi:beta-xylosidase
MAKILPLLLALPFTLAQPSRVLDINFPDPAIIQTEQGYYAFGTQSNGVRVPVARSDDFTSWTLLEGTDALPEPLPAWVKADGPQLWAPDVVQIVCSIRFRGSKKGRCGMLTVVLNRMTAHS